MYRTSNGDMDATNLRKVRSFVRRPGRITSAQRRALETLSARWGLPYEPRRIDLDAVFGRSAPRVLDVGFGDGEALVTCAANYPGFDYLGVEIHEPGVGHLLLLLERASIGNVRVIMADAVEVIEHMLEAASVDAIDLFFPDPWPKKRHHKRRIVQADFLAQCARILKSGGLMHLATDWADYAEHALAALGASPWFDAVPAEALAGEPLAFRPPTKFERRGRRLGHEVVDLYFRKRAVPLDEVR
ncbi:MAG TPA: tRNA (guanosine(46)-N7)-methyltransferase TrmB [Gammaproteobacteria bacterium]|nr:tRNA (guanosine(46)-N7)-methyltransferase TrmB [Gammaproteobacteria bacterium]